MKATKITIGLSVFIVLLLALTSIFTVTQGQHAIILRLGRLVNDAKTHKVKMILIKLLIL